MDTVGVTIQREPFTRELFEEAFPLLSLHWREIAHYDDIALNPDVERYLGLEQADVLRVFTARAGGALVGYACFFVSCNGHYSDSLQALQDILYVDPGWRCSTIGLRLIRACDEALRVEGVQLVLQHVKEAHPALAVILERMGYERIDVIYGRRLDRQGVV